jgi:hypothetical protein
MAAFDLEPSAATNYVLQLDGVDVDDKWKVEDLHHDPVCLCLVSKSLPQKGVWLH